MNIGIKLVIVAILFIANFVLFSRLDKIAKKNPEKSEKFLTYKIFPSKTT